MQENNATIDFWVQYIINNVKSFFLFSWMLAEQLKAHFGRQTGGFILVGAALAIFLVISRARFYRNNVAGVEGFSSFTALVVIRIIELALDLIAALCLLYGALFLGGYYFHIGDVTIKQDISSSSDHRKNCLVKINRYDDQHQLTEQPEFDVNNLDLTGRRHQNRDGSTLVEVEVRQGMGKDYTGWVDEVELTNVKNGCPN